MSAKPTHSGPKIPTQQEPDTSLIGIEDDGERRGVGEPNKKGNVAIADLPRRTPGGNTPHHCQFNHKKTRICLKKGCIIKCPVCGSNISSQLNTVCWTCKSNKEAEDIKKKQEEEAERKARKKNKATEVEEQSVRRKAKHTADQAQQRALQQSAAQEANQRRQIAKASAMAKVLFVRRPVGIRKRTGRVGERRSGRLARRQQNVYRRHGSGGVIEEEVATVDRMDEGGGEWEDVDVVEHRKTTATTGGEAERQPNMDEISALQRSIRKSLFRLTS